MYKRQLVYVPQRAVKGQALTNFLADHPIPDDWELNDDLPGEDVFFIDILAPWKMHLMELQDMTVLVQEWFLSLLKNTSSRTRLCLLNYVLIMWQSIRHLGLQMAIGMGIKDLNIYDDLQLVINQLLEEYRVMKEELVPYHGQA